MEVRDEELDKEKGMRNTTTSTTLDYNSPNRDSSPVGSEKLSHGNPIILNPPPHQTLAAFPHNQYNLSYRPVSKPRSRSTRDHHHHNQGSSPDPVTTVSPTSATPVASGSHLKTTATATAPASAAVEGGIIVVPVSSPPTRYRECLKNHAASSGRHVLDGCGEFMPSGEEGSADALKCAACDCHRNFHRKEIDGGESQYVPGYKDINRRNSIVLPPQHYHHLHHQPHPHPHHHPFTLHGLSSTPATGAGLIPPVMMAFGGGGGLAAESSSEDLNVFQSNYGGGGGIRGQQSSDAAGNSSKKRFRTKFNQEQKEKMMEFAEKLGWRIQKHDEQEVQVFCSDVGVKRQVFKVWMHNNKQAMKKKEM
ncbi:zinc-finger homeodomain protein 6 [Humulus lupulus]|uniref:zinc-finger homeodomain protein 6 n=1 Tax=Humulus lupulus TaxID=3486 RepID=UPI002B40FEF2|nr:zinc-finger homeodomain protein 6 [Humulus lupulus]